MLEHPSVLQLQGERVDLREFTEEHLQLPNYSAWLRDLEVVQGIYRLEYLKPLNVSEIEKYARSMIASKDDCYFGIHLKQDGQFVGTAKLGHIDWRTGTGDVGVLIGEKGMWGKGLATDAVQTLCSYAFKTLSLRKLTGGTAANNLGMISCFQKLGFIEEGRLRQKLLMNGNYIDQLLFGLFPSEFNTETLSVRTKGDA